MTSAVKKAFSVAGVAPSDIDLVELQDNTVYYELAFPEEWGLCEPGQAEWLLERGETTPTGSMPINPSGGFLCFGENVAARLIPGEFRPVGYQLRATRGRLNGFYNSLQNARGAGADQWVIDLYDSLYRQMNQAYSENRGLTGPLPLCGPTMTRTSATDAAGRSIAYTKPLLMLIDEFSTSTADSVPAMLQDAGRGILFGMRTNGAGGTNSGFDTGAYSEGFTGMTLGIMTRKAPVATPEYPTGPYIENIGVRPDIEVDYMTRDNLLQQGRPFVNAFTAAIVAAIQAGPK